MNNKISDVRCVLRYSRENLCGIADIYFAVMENVTIFISFQA